MKAFPTEIASPPGYRRANYDEGMDLRDYFAARAMQAVIVDPIITQTIEEEGVDHADFTAYLAYKVADAMMKAREIK